MIKNFGDSRTKKAFHRIFPKRVPEDLAKRMYMKLKALNTAISIHDLRTPPSNHLEQLHGFKEERYSIRVNQQWKICFTWDAEKGEASDVKLEDYH